MGIDIIDSIYMPVPAGQPTYFQFEDDFIEENVRCIPMIVRFKLDACGIKLKLAEWSKLKVYERNILIARPCISKKEIACYLFFLQQLILKRTGYKATPFLREVNPAWADIENINAAVQQKAIEAGPEITLQQWRLLNNLERFALLKLCRAGHENKNFPKAMKEFGLI